MNVDRIHDAFPAPEYRGYQRETLDSIRDAYQAGNDVVIVRAPTGSGKSLLARAICGCARQPSEAEAGEVLGAYYTTPQVSQLEDVADDDLLTDLAIVRGKHNYDCVLPDEHDTPVDQAPCVRKSGYDCSIRHRCPYYRDRAIAAEKPIAAMTLAYFMQTAGSTVFGPRDVCVIDEAHGLAEWAETYATIKLSPRTVPGWADISVPAIEDLEDCAAFAERLIGHLDRRLDAVTGKDVLSPAEVQIRDKCRDRKSELAWFMEDVFTDDGTTWLVDQAAAGKPIAIKPLEPARYLNHTVWDRASKFALLSATVLDKDAFCHSVGLNPDTVAIVDVPHTFPLENRPLLDATCGKMTYEHRDEVLPQVATTIRQILQNHTGEKGIVHCHSYSIQNRLQSLLAETPADSRLWVHDGDDRDDTLAAWKRSDGDGVFLSVKMEEALDLDGDLARFQVLCKAPFPNTHDSRVAHRLENDRWDWYYRRAIRTIIQACGRVVRSPDDYGATYLVDDSLLDCFDRGAHALPQWFVDQVEAIEEPSLSLVDHTTEPTEMVDTLEDGDGDERTEVNTGHKRDQGQNDHSTATSSNRRDSNPLEDVW